MRSTFYGIFLSVLVAYAGHSQDANDLDGKSLLCNNSYINATNPIYGLVFDKEYVERYEVKGYSKFKKYRAKYDLIGTNEVSWFPLHFGNDERLNRETLMIGSHQCYISSKKEVFQKLDEVISAAKKKNKI